MHFQGQLSLVTTFTSSAAANVSAWEQDRLDFFTSVKKNNVTGADALITKYPNEWKQWRQKQSSPLSVAQDKGSFDVFKLLLARGADINEDRGNDWTPIAIAYKNKQKQFFDYLLEEGANLDHTPKTSKDYSFKTSLLHMAVKRGDKDTMIRLLERGAKTNIMLSIGGLGGSFYIGYISSVTPEDYAAKKGRDVFADILKRAHVIRADYLAAQAAQPPAPVAVSAAPAADPNAGKIEVMNPLQIKKSATGRTP